MKKYIKFIVAAVAFVVFLGGVYVLYQKLASEYQPGQNLVVQGTEGGNHTEISGSGTASEATGDQGASGGGNETGKGNSGSGTASGDETGKGDVAGSTDKTDTGNTTESTDPSGTGDDSGDNS